MFYPRDWSAARVTCRMAPVRPRRTAGPHLRAGSRPSNPRAASSTISERRARLAVSFIVYTQPRLGGTAIRPPTGSASPCWGSRSWGRLRFDLSGATGSSAPRRVLRVRQVSLERKAAEASIARMRHHRPGTIRRCPGTAIRLAANRFYLDVDRCGWRQRPLLCRAPDFRKLRRANVSTYFPCMRHFSVRNRKARRFRPERL